MKLHCWSFSIGLMFSVAAYSQQREETLSKPNIVLFLVDDMGWQDTSEPFWKEITERNRRYHTPNMERMARQGMKFTDAYATPVCTPTRVSLMSGMNAARHKVTNWTSPVYNRSSDYPDSIFNAVSWNSNGMSAIANVPKTVHVTPLPQLLKDGGYYTIHTGKGHFAAQNTPASNPLNIGFLVNIGGSATGHPASYFSEKKYGNKADGTATLHGVPGLEKYYSTDTFLTEALTLETKAALDVPIEKKQPFFLYMSHYAIHIPLDADERFLKSYLDKGLDKTEAKYAALIEGMDKSLGDLMDYLDLQGVADNTIIIFMSDNGGLSLAPPRTGTAHLHNLPLRSGKGSVYEGGIRVPMLVKWPGVVPAASVTKRYVLIEDFFPSILEMAGLTWCDIIQKIDGRSFVSALKNPSVEDNNRNLIWHYPNKWIPAGGPGISWSSAIRKGNWKLIYDYKAVKLELYNLAFDIGEQNNLVARYPQKVKQLKRELTKSLKKSEAQMPVYKSTGKQVKWPAQIKN